MAVDVLNQLLVVPSLAPGAVAVVPHQIAYLGTRVAPDWVLPQQGTPDFEIVAASPTTISIQNTSVVTTDFILWLYKDPLNTITEVLPFVVGSAGDATPAWWQEFVPGTDVTAALTDVINATVQAGGFGGRIDLPAGGPFYLSSSIVFAQVVGLELWGQGARGTRFVWRGPANVPAFDLNRCQTSGLAHFSLEVETGYTLDCGVRIYQTENPLVGPNVVANQTSSRNFIMHCEFLFAQKANDGLRIVIDPASSTPDVGKNDLHYFEKVLWQGYNQAGVVIQGGGSVLNQFIECYSQGRTNGQVGVDTTRTILGVRRPGGFMWQGGLLTEHQVADFYLARRQGYLTSIRDAGSEKSARFLKLLRFDEDVAVLDRMPLSIHFHYQTPPANLASDGEVVQYYGNGPLLVSGDFGKETADAGYRFRFMSREQGGTQIPPQVVFHAPVSSIDLSQMFTAELPTSYRDAAYQDLGTSNEPLIRHVDNGRQKPAIISDWADLLDGIVPRCFYRFGETRPDFTYVPGDVDVALDQVTVTGHPFVTEDGPTRQSTTGALPDGLAVATDYWIIVVNANTVAFAASKADALAGVRVPLGPGAGAGTQTILWTGSDGSVYDCNRSDLAPINITPAGSPLYRQARAGFDDLWAEFVVGTIDQKFQLQNDTEIDPQTFDVAFLVHFGLIANTAANQYLCALGNGANVAGGGPHVKFSGAGLLRGGINGGNTDGTYNYLDAADHLLVAGYNRTAGGIFTLCTDQEYFTAGTSLAVANLAAKGLGTGSNAGTLASVGAQFGLFAVFLGAHARKLIAMGQEVQNRMGW